MTQNWFSIWSVVLFVCEPVSDGPVYDHTAYIECQRTPEQPLYGGGILKHRRPVQWNDNGDGDSSPAFVLRNLTQGSFYSFSVWVKVKAAKPTTVTARLKTGKTTYDCIGSVLARKNCWSFLKGGFVLEEPSASTILYLQSPSQKSLTVFVRRGSLQPFTSQEWTANQQNIIDTQRKRAVTVHVSDSTGNRLKGASIKLQQLSKDFPFGSAISKTILGNQPYQKWYLERFNAAVFENELKWYATEPKQGHLNYTVPDKMMEFVRYNGLLTRGHNIFWEDPKYTPEWVKQLTGANLHTAVESRIRSLMNKYREEFVNWDVSNEMLHYDFYEKELGRDATLHFFKTAHEADPLATLFMNDYNVVESCTDLNSTVDNYIARLKELQKGGATMDGIGLESHFSKPNPPLTRAIIDKLAALNLPIWLTEVDISKKFDQQTQARYLEKVLREGFSHPAVDGIMLWTALDPKGCYEMCLTDNDMNNLPAGDTVDKLLKEWSTGEVNGSSDEQGSYSFYGYLGEYSVKVEYGGRVVNSTLALSKGDETKQFSIRV
ncbi:Endo-1,4-beta-xylanase 5-like [Linum grandiflorum]